MVEGPLAIVSATSGYLRRQDNMHRPVSNPAVFINKFLAEKIEEVLPDYFGIPMFFVPSTPTDIQALYEGFPQANEDQPFAVYERMFRMSRGPFPHKKEEQVLYYLYKNGSLTDAVQAGILFETTDMIYNLLDRGDESAEELNYWIAQKAEQSPGTEPKTVDFDGLDFLLPYFHNTKVFQLEETRDIIDFATAKTYFGNKIIIDYCYHAPDFNPSPVSRYLNVPPEES
jgi:hypothetical protein